MLLLAAAQALFVSDSEVVGLKGTTLTLGLTELAVTLFHPLRIESFSSLSFQVLNM